MSDLEPCLFCCDLEKKIAELKNERRLRLQHGKIRKKAEMETASYKRGNKLIIKELNEAKIEIKRLKREVNILVQNLDEE